MPSLREYWESGFRALHIEENIGNAFADFAPYAGADEQRVVITRHSSPGTCVSASSTPMTSTCVPLGPASHVSSSSAVIMEESGDFSVQARDANVGCITFSTNGHLQLDAAVRMPLRSPSLRATNETTPAKEGVERDAETQLRAKTSKLAPQKPQQEFIHPVVKPFPSQLRFSDYTRPVALPNAYRGPNPTDKKFAQSTGPLAASFGQLEIDASLPDWDVNRQSLGARVGPAAVRLTRIFSAAATATATEAATAQLQNSGSLSDEDALTRTMLIEQSRKYQHTIDAALCVPFGGGDESAASSAAGSNKTGEVETVSRTLQGHRIALRTAPWALTCGLQFPLDLGDTLVGISLQNDRATSVSLPYPGVEWAVPASPSSTSSAQATYKGAGERVEASEEQPVSVACVRSLLHPNTSLPSQTDAVSASLPSYVVIPRFTFRFLLVQTLASHTLVRETSPSSSLQRDAGGSISLDTSAMTRLVSSYDWRRLPTLIGVNVGIDRERLRLSAASIVHDGDMDLEVAGVLDMTPWTPRMPTLVKVGYNNMGRFAAGITSFFYGTVSATLGVHVVRGEQAKFGIEVKC
ncbi:hypothetical protein ABL78_1471 [Leptomonas seymouri]|uniref:Uncharacterized protein n=1 Tax=Leptomonas seymouri TaxID=5684 RepID=A0A0N1PDA8_LEPSE|nr:hypothetical protein ABL78_1471 [Leptomonas seymouri]|eukprot:KPI89435.1 hypothetical protein ABL78_1471 [Leptomonas seymouri]